MKNNDSLQKFRAKVAIESLVKALLFAAMVMLGAMAIYTLMLNYIHARVLASVVIIVMVIIGLLALGGSFAYFYLKVFKTEDAKVASRVDGLGFEERATTMVEFDEDDSLIAQKQREDATEKMADIEPKQVKFKVPKLAIALLVAVAIFCIPTFFMLPNVMASQQEVNANKIITQAVQDLRQQVAEAPILNENKEELNAILDKFVEDVRSVPTIDEKLEKLEELQTEIREKITEYAGQADAIIKTMIDNLKQTVAESDVNDTVRAELNQEIAKLEQELAGTKTVSEKIEKITATSEAINKIIEENKTMDDVGQKMEEAAKTTESEALKELAEAIKNGNAQKAEDALDKLKEEMASAETKEALDKKIDEATEVLDKATENLPKDELTDAMKQLSDALKEAKKEPELPKEQVEVKEAIEAAKVKTAEALKQQTEQKNTAGEMQKQIDEAKEKLGQLPNDPTAPQESLNEMEKTIAEAKEKLGELQNSNSGSGSMSGSNSGSGSGSGSNSGSNSGSGSMSGSNSGSGSGSGSNSGSNKSGSGSNSGSTSGHSKSGSSSGSGSNGGSSSGSGSGDGSGMGSISIKPLPAILDGLQEYDVSLPTAKALYDAYLKSGNYDQEQLKPLQEYIEALEKKIETQGDAGSN